MKIELSKYYDENLNIDKYREAQIIRHDAKKGKKRNKKHYEACMKIVLDLSTKNAEMLCIGTRNNHERDVWRSGLAEKNISVYSMDIAPLSKSDYIMDFNMLPDNWDGKWDIIFSNSIDHAVDPTKTFLHWADKVKVGGIMAIGFDMQSVLSESDCCVFSRESVDQFIEEIENIECIDRIMEGLYVYYILRKLNV